VELFKSNGEGFSEGFLIGLGYFFQGIRAYLELTDVIREIEPIDQIPEIKTRLYRIPAYSQILESILSNIFRTIRDIYGGIEGKDYSSLSTLGSLRDFLISRGFKQLFSFVDTDVRNAINHGGAIVSPWETTFVFTSGKDRIKKHKTWTVRDPIGEIIYSSLGDSKPHFDDFIEGAIDCAGGILCGFVKYFCLHPGAFLLINEQIKNDEFLSNEYLCRALSLPGWTCTNIDTSIAEPRSQLNIHFFVSESDHKKLMQHSIETAGIVCGWIPDYENYMVGYRHPRMHSGTVLFKRDELEGMLEERSMPVDVMQKVLDREHFRILFQASNEQIDVEAAKRFRYPLLNGSNWKIREIEDVSFEEFKRFRANLYLSNAKSKRDVIEAIKFAIHKLKNLENPPNFYSKIKHGRYPAEGVYLKVFKKRSRRNNRIILPANENFICLAEWTTKNCIKAKKGGIPDHIWDQLIHEKTNKILLSWNPNFNL
jgi:hypothetical protein